MFNGRKQVPSNAAKQAPGPQHPHQHNVHAHPHAHHNGVAQQHPNGHVLPFNPHNTVLPPQQQTAGNSQRFTPLNQAGLNSAASAASSTRMPQSNFGITGQQPIGPLNANGSFNNTFVPAARLPQSSGSPQSSMRTAQMPQQQQYVSQGSQLTPRGAPTTAPAQQSVKPVTAAQQPVAQAAAAKAAQAQPKSPAQSSKAPQMQQTAQAQPKSPAQSSKVPQMQQTAQVQPKSPAQSTKAPQAQQSVQQAQKPSAQSVKVSQAQQPAQAKPATTASTKVVSPSASPSKAQPALAQQQSNKVQSDPRQFNQVPSAQKNDSSKRVQDVSSASKAPVQKSAKTGQTQHSAKQNRQQVKAKNKGNKKAKKGLNMLGHRLPWELVGLKGKLVSKEIKKNNKKAANSGTKSKPVEFISCSPFDERFPQFKGSKKIRTRGYVAVSPFDSRFPKGDKLQSIFSPKKAIPRIDRTVRNSKRQKLIRRRKAYQRSRIVYVEGKQFVSVSPWDAQWDVIVKEATLKARNANRLHGFVAYSPFSDQFQEACGLSFQSYSPFDDRFPQYKTKIGLGRVPRTRVLWQQRVVGYTPAIPGAVDLHKLPSYRMSPLSAHKLKRSHAKASQVKKPLKKTSSLSLTSSFKSSKGVGASLKKSTTSSIKLPIAAKSQNAARSSPSSRQQYKGAMARIHAFYVNDDYSPLHKPTTNEFPRFSPMAAKNKLHDMRLKFEVKSPLNAHRMNNIAPLSMLWV